MPRRSGLKAITVGHSLVLQGVYGMPEIDYVVLAEYVRQDAGMTHIMGAGIDTVTVPPDRLPAAIPCGVAVRITFDSRDQVGQEHELSLAFRAVDAEEDVLSVSNRFPTPARPQGVPDYWRTALSVAFRLPLPIPAIGSYRLTATLDDDPRRSRGLDFRAIGPDAGQS